MGSAIECFDDANAVVVPRSRFAPVKTCNDLFALRSGALAAGVGGGTESVRRLRPGRAAGGGLFAQAGCGCHRPWLVAGARLCSLPTAPWH
jgi:hypothetical protein